MEPCKVYFQDNFFSSGTTDVYGEDGQTIGKLDLISMFSSGVELQDVDGNVEYAGRFRVFSNRWEVTDGTGASVGELHRRLAFLAKRYTYDASDGGTFTIESEPFSREYVIFDENETQVATFQKVNTWLAPAAYELVSDVASVPTGELIVAVMGVNAIEKRERSHAGNP